MSDETSIPTRRQASGSPEAHPAAKRRSQLNATAAVVDNSSARRERRRTMLDPFANHSGAKEATPARESRTATPSSRETPVTPAPTPRTGLSKKDGDDIVAIKADVAGLRARIPVLETELQEYKDELQAHKDTTAEKFADTNEEFNEIAAQREDDREEMKAMRKEMQGLSIGRVVDVEEDVKPVKTGHKGRGSGADNLLKETVHSTLNGLMKRRSTRAKVPPSHLVDGKPVFWIVEEPGSRVLRPWWEGEWADQSWVDEVVKTIQLRGTAYNPEHNAEILKGIPEKLISDAIKTAWTSYGRSVNLAQKEPAVQQARASKNTQNSRKQAKAEKREIVLGSGVFPAEFVAENQFLRYAAYASSENTECESDGEDPAAKPPVIDASSPLQEPVDKAEADRPKKGKAHLSLVTHPPNYRTAKVNDDAIAIDDKVDYTNAKRVRRRGKERVTVALPKVNGPKGHPQDKVLIPVGKVKEAWFDEGERRMKYRTKTYVDLSGDTESTQAGPSNMTIDDGVSQASGSGVNEKEGEEEGGV